MESSSIPVKPEENLVEDNQTAIIGSHAHDEGEIEESKEESKGKVGSANVRYYTWNDEMTKKAQTQIDEDGSIMTEAQYEKLEKDAKRNWDIFYKNNKTNFYKDRHYIKYEFLELVNTIEQEIAKKGSKVFTLFDAGCGVGNGFYPLLAEFKDYLQVNCCDFSPRAVDFVKKHE